MKPNNLRWRIALRAVAEALGCSVHGECAGEGFLIIFSPDGSRLVWVDRDGGVHSRRGVKGEAEG